MIGAIDRKYGSFDVVFLAGFAEEYLGERGRRRFVECEVQQLIRFGISSGDSQYWLSVIRNTVSSSAGSPDAQGSTPEEVRRFPLEVAAKCGLLDGVDEHVLCHASRHECSHGVLQRYRQVERERSDGQLSVLNEDEAGCDRVHRVQKPGNGDEYRTVVAV